MNVEHVDATDNNNELWSIEDDGMFFPLGLSNHATGAGKSVFVTWSENYLLNFVFKKSKKTNKVQLTKVRLAIPVNALTGEQEEICRILILELNSLILMRSGDVYYFSSVKSMHPVAWLSGVRCIARAADGFSVIRWLESSNQLALQVYRDVSNLGKCESTLVHSYDITYNEENIFNCTFLDDGFCLLSQQVSADNCAWLEQLIGNCNTLIEGQQVHLFAVSCNVYALIAKAESSAVEANDDAMENNPENYHLELLNAYSSPVLGVHINEHLNFLLIFLECGIIDIWYVSSVAKALQRKCYTTGTQLSHYDIEMSQQCLIFLADEQKVTQLQCQYDSHTDTVHITESVKAIPGIVACTWVDSIQQLVCLSANNIFHQLSFDSSHRAEEEVVATPSRDNHDAEFHRLTPTKVAKLQEKSQMLKEFVEMPEQLQQQIDRECRQQQLIAVAQKTLLYQRLLDAKLEYAPYLPEPSADADETVYVYAADSARIGGNTLFALVYVQWRENEIFHTAQWHCKIDYGSKTHIIHLPANLINTKLCICVPLDMHDMLSPLPEFHAQLIAFVACGGIYRCIALHFDLKENAQSLRRLFSIKARRLNVSTNRSIEDSLRVAAKQRKPKVDFRLEHHLNLPPGSNFQIIRNIFGECKDTAKTAPQLHVYFLSSSVSITYEAAATRLKLESSNAVALFYTQLYIIHSLYELDYKYAIEPNALNALLQYQCNVEQCYGAQLDTADRFSSNDLHMENLKGVYAKLRLSEYLTIVKR